MNSPAINRPRIRSYADRHLYRDETSRKFVDKVTRNQESPGEVLNQKPLVLLFGQSDVFSHDLIVSAIGRRRISWVEVRSRILTRTHKETKLYRVEMEYSPASSHITLASGHRYTTHLMNLI